MTNTMSNSLWYCVIFLITLFIYACSNSLENVAKKQDLEVSAFVEEFLSKNMEITSQHDGIYSYILLFEIGEYNSIIKQVYKPDKTTILNDDIFEDLVKCMATLKNKDYKGVYKLKIQINTILVEYSVKLISS